jgi:hypothetical protein
MPRKTMAMRDGHTTEDERAIFCKLVNVVADAGHGEILEFKS